MTKILITGGAGFVASHLAERLLRETTHQLVLLDNFADYYDPAQKRENIRNLADEERVALVTGDFCNPELCRALFDRLHPTHVVHLGATPGVPYSLERPLHYVENNVGGTTALLEVAREYPVERFLFASSSTVYGLGVEPPFREDGPLGVPASPYGASKRAAESMGFTYHQLFGVPFTALRLFNVYGPRLRPDLALSIFTGRILRGTPIDLYGDGSVRRDFTHVHDICSGILSALTATGIAGEAINLGHNDPIEVRRLIQLIEESAGRRAILRRQPPRAGDMPVTCADLAKANQLLDYSPTVPIEEGVREYVQWFREKHFELPDAAAIAVAG
jgi:UDP-glucuronate 4-epimerase